jgi:hypothetical protein
VRLTRNLLAEVSAEPLGAARLEALRRQIDERAAALDRLAASAPDGNARSAVNVVQQELRGLMSAVDGEQLLRTGPEPHSNAALADAAATRATHANALDAALARLDALAGPPRATGPAAAGTSGLAS